MKKKANLVQIILNILIVVLVVVCVFCIYKLSTIWWEYRSNRQTQEQVQELFYGQVAEEAASGEDKGQEREYAFDLTPVIKANADTVGWLKLPGTVIDYAVVQGQDNDWYLKHGFYGEENAAGAIFMDYQNEMGAPLQNLIVYGHRMKDGSMFDSLGEFLDFGFYQQHPTFTLITEEKTYECQIFAVYQCTDAVDYCRPTFATKEEMNDYIQACQDRSAYQTTVEVSAADTILTLSTCDYVIDPEAGRLVVQAKLVAKDGQNGKPAT